MADYGMATGVVNEAIYNNSTSSTGTSSSNKATGKYGDLGKNDFLALLIAQLKYQDPLNPMEDKEFIGQLTQFSTLEQITNMSTNLEKFLTSQQGQGISSAAAMIGKEVRDAQGNGGVVTGISLEEDGLYLLIGEEKMALSEVKVIKNSS
jgi:flagellar basal-body rod modification protein FlgD